MIDTNNEDPIDKMYKEYHWISDIGHLRDDFWNFYRAVYNNLPQSISREAVEKLREKREEKRLQVEARDSSRIQAITLIVINEFYKDLEALLCNQKDD